MSDVNTLVAALDFGRGRLLGILDAIEKSGQPVEKVLAWRPGAGRAHIGWQAMHCAATLDRYMNVRMKGGTATFPEVVEGFGGGSTPSDSNVPSIGEIRSKLEATYSAFKAFAKTTDLSAVTEFPNNVKRTAGESIMLLTWHEAHHQGQIHLTWNLYKAAHGVS